MKNAEPHRIKTISQYHQAMGLPKPEHPLISILNFDALPELPVNQPLTFIYDFYSIYLKRISNVKFKYGQQESDFDEGVLFFMAPNQVFTIEADKTADTDRSGWIILIHPDFLWNTTLARTIKQYEYFGYAINEALYLSAKEEKKIIGIIKNIQQEYDSNIDKFSQDIIISQLEVLFNYSDRFYHRQFITRKITNHKVLTLLEDLLTEYFNSDILAKHGLPSVQYVAQALNMSPNYLGGLLKSLTGQNTQQHIHNKLIEKAKERLSTTNLSVSEIAYELGFEHLQSFSKLFKSKSGVSPVKFRANFN